jgi:hypothetical protein
VHTSVSPLRAAVVAAVMIVAVALAVGCGSGGTLAPSPPTTILPNSGSGSASPSPSSSVTTFSPSPIPTSTVRPGQHIPDDKIKASLLKKIGKDPLLLHVKITIVVHNGVVYLYGTVPTSAQKHEVENWAITEPGVKKVVSYIVVNPGEGGGSGTGPY